MELKCFIEIDIAISYTQSHSLSVNISHKNFETKILSQFSKYFIKQKQWQCGGWCFIALVHSCSDVDFIEKSLSQFFLLKRTIPGVCKTSLTVFIILHCKMHWTSRPEIDTCTHFAYMVGRKSINFIFHSLVIKSISRQSIVYAFAPLGKLIWFECFEKVIVIVWIIGQRTIR